VCFTGSTEVARLDHQPHAGRQIPGPIVPLIAETGGQNALIADSSALPEQVVQGCLASAFNSAGQRCSALRVLFVQTDIADKVIEDARGAMQELTIGDPAELRTDVGPVIDEAAHKVLDRPRPARQLRDADHLQLLDEGTAAKGTFFAPRAYEIDSLASCTGRSVRPILHVLRWKADELDKVMRRDQRHRLRPDARHPQPHRRDGRAHHAPRLGVGNTYVNRNIIGAVVGVQPFGGEGLSGTGPKAGGPHYLCASPANARSRSTPPRRAAMPRC
jgi:RHH-type proline utilization regulon transcriptional repressor/proline dehydrogenase/delta 1-pyrroline-5-carboxylate dehydrogenase